jgi:hypothetical protein
MLTDIVKEKLESLNEKLDSGSINLLTRKPGFPGVSRLGDKQNTAPLPTLSGSVDGIDFSLDFVPFPDGGFLMDIDVHVKSPFRLVMVPENAPSKSLKFKSSGFVGPIQEVNTGIKEIDEKYFMESNDETPVKKYFSGSIIPELINSLGNFDKLTFHDKYVKIIYFIEDLENLDMDWVFKTIKGLTDIAKVITRP